MGFAYPLGFALAALALPLVLLYVLKLRRRPQTVSSTLLWRRVVEDRRANAPWERLRRHLLLLLQLLFLLALVLAFAGPFRHAAARLADDTVIVLDASASMSARTGSGPGSGSGSDFEGLRRFDAARERVAELLKSVESTRRAALVLAGPQPEVLVPLSGDAARLARELAAAEPFEAPADLRGALELARTLVRGRAGGEVLLVTDGAFDTPPALAALLAECRVILVGEPRPNAGIVSVALRPAPGSADGHEIFAGVAAHGGRPRAADLVLSAAASQAAPDDESSWTEVARESLILEPGGRLAQLFRVNAAPGTLLRLALVGPQDALPIDDRALLVVPRPPEVRVLLASETPFLLSRALGAVPGLRLFSAAGLPPDADGFDLVVVEGALPELLPRAPLLVFGAGSDAAQDGERLREPRVLRWERRHPVLRNVDLAAVRIEEAFRVQPPRSARVLIESDGGALAASWEGPGGRVLHFAFDLVETDLPLRVAFPVLVHDAVDWLTRRGASSAVLAAGRSQELALDELAAAVPPLTWTPPGGRPRELQPRAGSLRLPAPRRAGLGLLQGRTEDGTVLERRLAVALLSPEESNLGARVEAGEPVARSGSPMSPAQRVPGRRFLWPWVVALALGLSFVEWAFYHRRAG